MGLQDRSAWLAAQRRQLRWQPAPCKGRGCGAHPALLQGPIAIVAFTLAYFLAFTLIVRSRASLGLPARQLVLAPAVMHPAAALTPPMIGRWALPGLSSTTAQGPLSGPP